MKDSNNNSTFSDSLTVDQVRRELDAIGVPWREYSPNAEGWIDINGNHFYEATGYAANSDVGINIYHGGFVDHYMHGHPGDEAASGDIVRLAEMILVCSNAEAIAHIKQTLGIKGAVEMPDLPEGYRLPRLNRYFTRVPDAILKSKLPPAAKIVWAAIQRRCIKKKYAFAGFRRMADDTGMSINTVRKAYRVLQDTGLVLEVSRGKARASYKFPVEADAELINTQLDRIKFETRAKAPYQTGDTPPYQTGDTEVYEVINEAFNVEINKEGNGSIKIERFPFSFFYPTAQPNIKAYSAYVESNRAAGAHLISKYLNRAEA